MSDKERDLELMTATLEFQTAALLAHLDRAFRSYNPGCGRPRLSFNPARSVELEKERDSKLKKLSDLVNGP